MFKSKQAADTPPADKTKKPDDKPKDGGWRETVESIAMAIILALLFRGFVAEAFVIPTGSMAPTLMGLHKDVCCPECGHWYTTGASSERTRDGDKNGWFVTTTTCPICRYTQRLDLFNEPNQSSFSGDRILVSKFAYDVGEPRRWDVIVFKCPGEATQNYIKRLIGLPNEVVRVQGGNIYIQKLGEDFFTIARKPNEKLGTILQIVDDTRFIPQKMVDLKWPPRWREWSADGQALGAWKTEDGGRTFTCEAGKEQIAWLRYAHIVPTHDDWVKLIAGQLPSDVSTRPGSLITDYCAYNAPHAIQQNRPYTWTLTPGTNDLSAYNPALPGPGEPPPASAYGVHWVDDLAVEAEVKVESAEGEIWLDLVRGGVHHRCQIQLADGKALLSMTNAEGQSLEFTSEEGKEKKPAPTATTRVSGPGTYRLRLTNLDHEMRLFVNGSFVPFDGPTTYSTEELVAPQWSENDPLDAQPAGVGAKGAKLQVNGLQVYRDFYYIATSRQEGSDSNDYIDRIDGGDPSETETEQIQRLFADPTQWSTSSHFDKLRRWVEFELKEDQFFPMGDNSSHSLDARLWGADPHVDRDLLIGRAMFVYWPHTWNRPVPFTPNLRKMRPIR